MSLPAHAGAAVGDITALADRWSSGDDEAFRTLIELTYPRLLEIAKGHCRKGERDFTLDPTAVVHEAYLRLNADPAGRWPSRAHFFAFCSKIMRHVLIDYARWHSATKRGGALVRVPLSEDAVAVQAEAADTLLVDEALRFLAQHDERMVRIVECRFFGALSIPETAEALGISERTVVREWTRARAYLLRKLRSPSERVPEA